MKITLSEKFKKVSKMAEEMLCDYENDDFAGDVNISVEYLTNGEIFRCYLTKDDGELDYIHFTSSRQDLKDKYTGIFCGTGDTLFEALTDLELNIKDWNEESVKNKPKICKECGK